jgi:hypothetical protein
MESEREGGALLPCTARILRPIQPKKLCKKSKNRSVYISTFQHFIEMGPIRTEFLFNGNHFSVKVIFKRKYGRSQYKINL